ncbi:hypothetical protein ACVILH_005735 [Bradyrhizobium sp. USDA 4353]
MSAARAPRRSPAGGSDGTRSLYQTPARVSISTMSSG